MSRRDAADGQDGSQKEEHAEEQKDTARTETEAVSGKNKTESVAAVAVATTLKDKATERGGQEEDGSKQETVERKKTEGAGTSQGIQGHGLSQEKDDDDDLPDESPSKRKSKSKRKKAGDQGASASKTAPWVTEAKETGATAAGVGVEAKELRRPPELLLMMYGSSSSVRRSTSRKHVASCASSRRGRTPLHVSGSAISDQKLREAAEGVGQSFKKCWRRGRVLL